jgi:23S rRNA pseudouridine1911/1915/1917 synthase
MKKKPTKQYTWRDLEVIYEDNHLIVVNKPSGMPTQEDSSYDPDLFTLTKAYIKETYQKPGNVYLGLLHRLDRPTSGIVVMARTSKAAARVTKQFSSRKVRKVYYAITEGSPANPVGNITSFLKQLPGKNIMRSHVRSIDGAKKSELTYKLIREHQGRALLSVEPLTGRKHQIRVQLASIGCPIAGDVKYGKHTQALPDKSIALLAKEIELVHPTLQQKMRFRVDFPAGKIWDLFRGN